jgi:GR25 family glycosyltransferase involved in LPS biosynthesis
MVIEDDETFNSRLENIEILICKVPEDEWDIIYLDFTVVEIEDILYLARYINENKINEINSKIIKIPEWFTPYGTHAYIINNKFKKKLYEMLKENKLSGLPIDNVLCLSLKSSLINTFVRYFTFHLLSRYRKY